MPRKRPNKRPENAMHLSKRGRVGDLVNGELTESEEQTPTDTE